MLHRPHTRLEWVGLSFVLGTMVALGQLSRIQGWQREVYLNPTGIAYRRTFILPARRGDMYDCNQRLLATSRQVYSIAANPQEITALEKVAQTLAPVLNLSEERLRELLTRRLRPVPLPGEVTPDLLKRLAPLIQRGILTLSERLAPPKFTIYALPYELKISPSTEEQLALLLGLSPQDLHSRLTAEVPLICLQEGVDEVTAEKIEGLSLPGLLVQLAPPQVSRLLLLQPRPEVVEWRLEDAGETRLPPSQRPVIRQEIWRTLVSLWPNRPLSKGALERQMKNIFVYLRREVSPEVAQQVENLRLRGVQVKVEFQRWHPLGDLAWEVLGRTDVDEHGITGLEQMYDLLLRGQNGSCRMTVDATGRPIPQQMEVRVPPLHGKDLVLTLDSHIQWVAEQVLEQAVTEHDADWGTAIVMVPQTGAVLALANFSSERARATHSNRALTFALEPGSALKPLVVCAALEEGVASPREVLYCSGSLRVGKTTLHCIAYYTPQRKHGRETVSDAIRDSCNVVLIQLAQRLQQAKLEKWFRKFGLFERTGLGLRQYEACGHVYVPRDDQGEHLPWSPQKVATVSYGKGIQVTAIALARAYCAITNGGYLPPVHIVKQIQDHRGRVVSTFPEVRGPRILSARTAIEVREMLRRVVAEKEGTGYLVRSPLYELAGKTGTSLGYRARDPRIVSFVGFAPFDRPRLVCLVLMANPRGPSRTGSLTCGPAFRQIVEATLKYWGVPPDLMAGTRLQP